MIDKHELAWRLRKLAKDVESGRIPADAVQASYTLTPQPSDGTLVIRESDPGVSIRRVNQ